MNEKAMSTPANFGSELTSLLSVCAGSYTRTPHSLLANSFRTSDFSRFRRRVKSVLYQLNNFSRSVE